MKNIRLLFLVAFFVILTSLSNNSTVYICKGKSATKYHLVSNCRGLSNCSTDIYKVTLEEAKKIGRTLCGWED